VTITRSTSATPAGEGAVCWADAIEGRSKQIAAMLHPRRKINGRLMITSENSSPGYQTVPEITTAFPESYLYPHAAGGCQRP
jgi:hypothetical protein